MSFRRAATATLWQLGSQIVMAALSIITVKFVAMGLSKELAGFYNSAYGYLQLFGILADFGLYAVAVREMSSAKEKEKVLATLILLRGTILLLSLGSALLIAWVIPQWQGTPLPHGIAIAALVPFFTLLAGMLRTVFQVTYKMHFVFIAEVTQRVVTVLLIGWFVLGGTRESMDTRVYEFFLYAGGIGAAVLFLISIIAASRLIRIRLSFDATLLRSIFLRALPFGIAFLCMAMYRQLDVTLIALLRPDFELQNAHYGFALRMTEMGMLIPTFLLNSVLPLLSDETKQSERDLYLTRTFFIILILGTVAALYSFFWATPVMSLLTTSSYLADGTHAGADTALRMLSVPLLLNGVILFWFYVFLTLHAWKKLVMIMMCGAVISLSLNMFLIPRFGFEGAALTSGVTHLFLMIALASAGKHLLRVTLPLKGVMQWIIFAIVFAVVLSAIVPILTTSFLTVCGIVATGTLLIVLLSATGLLETLKRPV